MHGSKAKLNFPNLIGFDVSSSELMKRIAANSSQGSKKKKTLVDLLNKLAKNRKRVEFESSESLDKIYS